MSFGDDKPHTVKYADHQSYNLNYKISDKVKIPLAFHILRVYDSHLIAMQSIGKYMNTARSYHKLRCHPSKYGKVNCHYRFNATNAYSLANYVKSLPPDEFRYTDQYQVPRVAKE